MLLDTNALIWLLTEPKRLGSIAFGLANKADDLWVSVASQYEVAIKERLGRVELLEKLESEMKQQLITQIPLSISQFRQLASLKNVKHRDPFDLMIVAVAIERKLTLLTSDRTILSMNISGLKTIDARK